MNGTLDELRELTSRLIEFPEEIEVMGERHEYAAIDGVSFAWNLKNVPGEISVADWFNSDGCKFPMHSHKEREWVIVYKGVMHLFIGGHKITLEPGDGYYIPPNEPHTARFSADTRYLAITIPDCADWPK